MNLERIVTSKWFRFFNWLWNAFLFNLLMIFMAFGIVTFFPGLVSLFKTIEDLKKDPSRFALKYYFINFKREFKKTWLPGLFHLEFVSLFVYSLFIYSVIFSGISDPRAAVKVFLVSSPVLAIGFFVILIIIPWYFLILAHSAMIMARLNLRFFDSLRFSIFFSFRFFFQSLVLILMLLVSAVVLIYLMPLWFFVGIGFPFVVWELVIHKIYDKIYDSKEEDNNMLEFGIDQFNKLKEVLGNKRLGLITNPTGINKEGIPSYEILNNHFNLVALFAPEHGIKGNVPAGVRFESYYDETLKVKVHSLYTKDKRPTKEMLDDIDTLVIDIQDGGSRFYTYIYTMAYAMEACKEHNKEVVILDRPNPLSRTCEGNILDSEYRSFIGYFPIVQRHGMTIGELALMFNEEFKIGCKLTIVSMKGYNPDLYYDELGRIMVPLSPNYPNVETGVLYNGTCIFEGTNVSEGRGTTLPFRYIGAPYIDGTVLANKMNEEKLPGVWFRPVYFTPNVSKHQGVMCSGVDVIVYDRQLFEPVTLGYTLLYKIRELYPNDFKVNPPFKEGMKTMLELNTGSKNVIDNLDLKKLLKLKKEETETFKKLRKPYLLYKGKVNG